MWGSRRNGSIWLSIYDDLVSHFSNPAGCDILAVIYTVAEGDEDMSESDLLQRITIDPRIFGGKPIVRG